MVVLCDEFVSSIAQALNDAGVSCVLWGHLLLRAHGVPTIVASLDFIVSDDCLDLAVKTLSKIETLVTCPNPATCLASSPDQYTPVGAAHFHIDGLEVTIDLFLQSKTLWFLPPLNTSLSATREHENFSLPPHFCLASDDKILPPSRPGRGPGVHQSGFHPVIVPKAHILLEAYLRLHARDSGKRIGSFSMAMICYIEEYVDDDGLLDSDLIPEPLGTLYRDLRTGKVKSVRQWEKELKEAVGAPQSDD